MINIRSSRIKSRKILLDKKKAQESKKPKKVVSKSKILTDKYERQVRHIKNMKNMKVKLLAEKQKKRERQIRHKKQMKAKLLAEKRERQIRHRRIAEDRKSHSFPIYKKNSNRYLFIYDRFGRYSYQKIPKSMMKNSPMFDMIPVKDISLDIVKKYDVVCLDMVIKNYMDDDNFDKFTKLLKRSGSKIVIFIHDIHETTFTRSKIARDLYISNNYSPPKSPGYGFQKFKKYLVNSGCQHIISYCRCPELDLLKDYCKDLLKSVDIIPFHVDKDIFTDYGYKKKYDVCLLGKTVNNYRFRDRLHNIIRKMKDKYNIRIFDKRVKYEKLPKIFNMSWLSVTTVSNYSHLVRKYTEISASNSVILGDINEQGREIWGDNLIELTDKMSNTNIEKAVMNALKNKDKLKQIASTMSSKILSEYTYNDFNRKIYNVMNRVSYRTVDNYFDRVYILNLDRQPERWDLMKKKLKEIGCSNYERFRAIDGSSFPYIEEWKEYSKKPFNETEKKLKRKMIRSPGAWGYNKSAIGVLQNAKKKGYRRILFMDDDVIFSKDFQKRFSDIKIPVSWKVLYLGASDANVKARDIKDGFYKNLDKYVNGSFCVGIDCSVFDMLIKITGDSLSTFDSGSLRAVNTKFKKSYVVHPNLAIADVRKSTIQGDRDQEEWAEILGWNLGLYRYNCLE